MKILYSKQIPSNRARTFIVAILCKIKPRLVISFQRAFKLHSHASGPISTRCFKSECSGKASTTLHLVIPRTYEDVLTRCAGIPSLVLSWRWHDLQCCSCPQPRHRLRSCRCHRKWSPHAHSACQLSRTKISRMSPNTQRRASTPQV